MLVAAHVGERPWSGAKVSDAGFGTLPFDPGCYLCPGNPRVTGERNPDYGGVFVFENDFASWSNRCPPDEAHEEGLFRTFPVAGAGRVVCYERRHDLTLAQLEAPRVADFFAVLKEEYRAMKARPEIRYVHMFENKGKIVGVSNPHPHCQIYGSNTVFPAVLRELEACREHADRHGGNLLRDMAEGEMKAGSRIVFRHPRFVSFVPFAARLPYETYLVPTLPAASLEDLDAAALQGLAAAVLETAIRYDNLYRMSFPYVMCLYQAPVDGGNYDHYQFHIKFMPLLRNPTAQKFLAGPELGGDMMINPKCPEIAAREMAEASTVHFLAAEGQS